MDKLAQRWIMYSLNIKNESIYLKDVEINQLPEILKWYNKVDVFSFATGIDTPIVLRDLKLRYTEAAICSREFFCCIYKAGRSQMIGILKGTFQKEKDGSIWINSIIIDPKYQNMGYGGMVLDLILNHFKSNKGIKHAYLAVVEDNKQGRAFWTKHNFKEIKTIKNHLKLQDRYWDVIIMHRKVD